ncbi:hypothetical protein B0H14DRAFT_2827498 [Mycena olivaceomarginata]|nr:hypothetical protein B0H14DRAFT_2827498 [Mycena olivaceomarginata]
MTVRAGRVRVAARAERRGGRKHRSCTSTLSSSFRSPSLLRQSTGELHSSLRAKRRNDIHGVEVGVCHFWLGFFTAALQVHSPPQVPPRLRTRRASRFVLNQRKSRPTATESAPTRTTATQLASAMRAMNAAHIRGRNLAHQHHSVQKLVQHCQGRASLHYTADLRPAAPVHVHAAIHRVVLLGRLYAVKQ